MLRTNGFALKEWAVIVQALGAGQQVLLLRKGGILDEGREFRLEHSEFFLYPTFEHQHRKFLRQEFLAGFDKALPSQPPHDKLILDTYAEVTDVLVAKELAPLQQLSPYHLWNGNYLEMRWNYKPEVPLHVLVLRVHRLAAVKIPFRAEYAGCKSWVELDREVALGEACPALSEAEFARRRLAIRGQLGAEATAGVPIKPA